MVSKGVRRVVAVICAIALTALVGCSSDDDAKDNRDSSSDAVPAPEPPAAMSGDGTKAVTAFVNYYWAVVSHAQATGDTSTLRDLAGDECEPCEAEANRIEKLYDEGGSISGGEAEVAGLQVFNESEGATTYDAVVDLEFAKRTVTASESEAPVDKPARYESLDFTVSHFDGEWKVERFRTPTPE